MQIFLLRVRASASGNFDMFPRHRDPRIYRLAPLRGRVTLREKREKAHRFAAGIVAAAIAILGVTLAALAVFLVIRGGWGFLFVSIILFVIGAAMTLLGFFFQLVPFRVAELAQGKRDYDKRERLASPPTGKDEG